MIFKKLANSYGEDDGDVIATVGDHVVDDERKDLLAERLRHLARLHQEPVDRPLTCCGQHCRDQAVEPGLGSVALVGRGSPDHTWAVQL